MKKEDLINFLNFRKKFTKREWSEINKLIEDRERQKADKLELDDFDIEVILDRVAYNPFLEVGDGKTF